MDFGLSPEQELLEASLRRFLDEEMPIERVREWISKAPGEDGGSWPRLAELGIAGLLVPEALGGSGLDLLDAAVAAESLASRMAPAPFLATAVMSVIALREAGSEAQHERWLPGIAAGRTRIGVAASELCGRREDAGVERRDDRLHGKSLMVLDAAGADHFLVPTGPDGDSLALVAAGARGVTQRDLTTIDRSRGFAELVFEGAEPADWIGEPGATAAASARMLDAGRIVLAADALGASERAIELAVAYAGQRVQFGRAIGSFQAVKHLCAEMVAELEPARALVWYAAHAFDALPAEASLMACHAKAHLSEIATQIVRVATEVHGGIGFTEEQNLHLWFKRAGADRQLLGTPSALRERAARLQGWLQA
jgi:alkylation response protein AidB-like acyl-CoA dehydrogenase